MVSFAIPHDHQQWLVDGTQGVELARCRAMDAVRAYLDRPTLDWNIILASKHRGSGKSFAAAWLLERIHELAPSRRDVHDDKMKSWGSAPLWCECAALRDLKAYKQWEREAAYSRIAQAWVVVIDDIGKEDDHDLVSSLLTRRQSKGLLTICTTNLVYDATDALTVKDQNGDPVVEGQPSKDWSDRLDARITSRLRTRGDQDRGGIRSWCYCPHPDMRGRVEPVLKSQRKALVDRDRRTGGMDRGRWGDLALQVLAEQVAEGDEHASDALDEVARRAAGPL